MYRFTMLLSVIAVLAVLESIALPIDKASAQSRYFVGSELLTWTDARAYCQQRGGDLVVIESAEENEVVRKLIEDYAINPQGCWIGASDVASEGVWRWVNGARVTRYSNWKHWEPNNLCGGEHYAHMWSYGKWNDQKNDGRCNGYGLMQPVCEVAGGATSKVQGIIPLSGRFRG